MSLALKPNHATVKAYYETLHQFGQLYIDHEGAVRSAFQTLLAKCGQRADPKLTLVPEYLIKRARTSVRVDGALIDDYKLPHGYWEAKDEKDDLLKEVQNKLDKGYPSDNTIFQAPERAILYQGGTRIFDENISKPEALVSVVNQFFTYKAPRIDEWLKAVDEFSERVPELSQQVENLIKEERRRNPNFLRAFQEFYELCRQAINPNLTEEAVERLLEQHTLNYRMFHRIDKKDDFRPRNVAAAEIEKVITESRRGSWTRDDFVTRLEPFSPAIERNGENATSYTEKQDFLNTVYMRFFQGYSPKDADTHGIVYTPQPIVNFMVRSVEEVLQKEFGRSLGDKGVHILDPFVGTGNFITRVMKEIKATDLQYKYENELHCNEVMLLPYYIASMNIERSYFDRIGTYKEFPGICLVDTFELAESKQVPMFTEQNTQRVAQEKHEPFFAISGTPPYNSKQLDENDENQNRTYPVIDSRIAETYTTDSVATLRNKLSDPYVRAFRWASDRVGGQGVVAFVTNDSYIDQIAFDGMRKHLSKDFETLYVLDLGGNVRKNPKLSGTTHNVFGIQIGVSIALLVRTGKSTDRRILYARIEESWTRQQKYDFLEKADNISGVQWQALKADALGNWLLSDSAQSYLSFVPLGKKSVKRSTKPSGSTIFQLFSLGVVSSRDAYAYNFDALRLHQTAQTFIDIYGEKRAQIQRKNSNIDSLVDVNDVRIKWTRQTKAALRRGAESEFIPRAVRSAVYRPFTRTALYFDDFWNEEQYRFRAIFPLPETDRENIVFCATGRGAERPFACMAGVNISDLNFFGPGTVPQWFPFYTYAEDGPHRRENITDWALERFRAHYHDPSITKWDIFHYIYAVLHHPEYRERSAANLRRELPRIPFASYVGFSSALSSRAEHERPEDGHAESRDPMPAGAQQRPSEEFPPRNAVDSARMLERPYEKLTGEAKERFLSEWKAEQDSGELHYTSQDNAWIFRAFAKAGQRLAEIHVHYEQQPEYKLTKVEKKGEKLDYRVTKMKLSKDKTTLIYN